MKLTDVSHEAVTAYMAIERNNGLSYEEVQASCMLSDSAFKDACDELEEADLILFDEGYVYVLQETA